MSFFKVIEKRVGQGNFDDGSWRATVEVLGSRYLATLERGSKPIQIAYSSKRGWHWFGYVRDTHGNTLWDDQVTKSTGLVYMLEAASLIPNRDGERLKLESYLKDSRRYAVEAEKRAADLRAKPPTGWFASQTCSDAEEAVRRTKKSVLDWEAAVAIDDMLRAKFGLPPKAVASVAEISL